LKSRSPGPGDTHRNRFRARGFVTAPALVLAAIGIPNVGQRLRQYRMGSAATRVADLIERTRYWQNTTISCRYQQQGSNWVMCMDLNGNGTMDPTEPQLVLPSDAQILPARVAPGPGRMGAAHIIAIPPPRNGNTYVITLDSLGGSRPSEDYKAVNLTPAGRSHVWNASYDGNR